MIVLNCKHSLCTHKYDYWYFNAKCIITVDTVVRNSILFTVTYILLTHALSFLYIFFFISPLSSLLRTVIQTTNRRLHSQHVRHTSEDTVVRVTHLLLCILLIPLSSITHHWHLFISSLFLFHFLNIILPGNWKRKSSNVILFPVDPKYSERIYI